MPMQPSRALDPPLKQGTVEGVLEITCAQLRHGLDDFQPSEVGRVAHGRAPVSADDGNMQQFGAHLNKPYSCIPIIRADCRFQRFSQRIGGNPLLQFGPMSETILKRDDELSVAESKGTRS